MNHDEVLYLQQDSSYLRGFLLLRVNVGGMSIETVGNFSEQTWLEALLSAYMNHPTALIIPLPQNIIVA